MQDRTSNQNVVIPPTANVATPQVPGRRSLRTHLLWHSNSSYSSLHSHPCGLPGQQGAYMLALMRKHVEQPRSWHSRVEKRMHLSSTAKAKQRLKEAKARRARTHSKHSCLFLFKARLCKAFRGLQVVPKPAFTSSFLLVPSRTTTRPSSTFLSELRRRQPTSLQAAFGCTQSAPATDSSNPAALSKCHPRTAGLL